MFDIGSSLREARTRQGLDFDEMEARTKVRAKYLRFLEEERFEQLPGHTYTKGFLRVYAEALGLDGDLYVDEYNSRYVGLEDDAVRISRPPVGRRPDPRRRSSHSDRTVVVALAAILLATALVIAAWRFGGEDEPKVQGINAAASALGKPQKLTLLISAPRGATFLDVRRGSPLGKPLFVGTLERGATQRFTGTALYLRVAKPKNVAIRVDGARRTMPKDGELTLGAAAGVKG